MTAASHGKINLTAASRDWTCAAWVPSPNGMAAPHGCSDAPHGFLNWQLRHMVFLIRQLYRRVPLPEQLRHMVRPHRIAAPRCCPHRTAAPRCCPHRTAAPRCCPHRTAASQKLFPPGSCTTWLLWPDSAPYRQLRHIADLNWQLRHMAAYRYICAARLVSPDSCPHLIASTLPEHCTTWLSVLTVAPEPSGNLWQVPRLEATTDRCTSPQTWIGHLTQYRLIFPLLPKWSHISDSCSYVGPVRNV
jgi:hypothetical protein